MIMYSSNYSYEKGDIIMVSGTNYYDGVWKFINDQGQLPANCSGLLVVGK